MPELREYRQQVSAPGDMPSPQARGSDFSGAGEGMRMLGQATQQAASDLTTIHRLDEEQRARREVTSAQVTLAQMQAAATKELDDSVQNGTAGFQGWSDTYTKGWSDKLDEFGSKLETVSGRRAFELGSAELRGRLLISAGRANAQVAGAEAVQKYTEFVDAQSNQLMQNPGDFENVLQNTVNVLNDPNGLFSKMSAEHRFKLEQVTKREMAKAAVVGAIDLDPKRALASLQLGHYNDYLDSNSQRELMVSAKVAINAQYTEAERLRKEQERLRKEEVKQIQDSFIPLLDQNKLTSDTVIKSKLDPVGEGSKEHFLNVILARAKEAAKEKPFDKNWAMFSDVLKGIREKRITSESQIEQIFVESSRANRGVDWEMLKSLRQEFNDMRTPQGEILSQTVKNFEEKFKHQIDKSNPMLGQIDQQGQTQYGNWQRFVLDKVNEYKSAGKDPYLLFREGAPDYLARPEVLQVFQRTLQDSIKEGAERIRRGSTGAAPQSTLGSEPGWVDNFLRRIGVSTVIEDSNIDLAKWATPVDENGKPVNVPPLVTPAGENWFVLPMADESGKLLSAAEAVKRAQEKREYFGIYKTKESAEKAAEKIAKAYEAKAETAKQDIVINEINATGNRAAGLESLVPQKQAPKIPPRNPGESISEYQKRIRGQQ